MDGERVDLTVSSGVARLSLMRADAGNAIDGAMVQALDEAMDALEKASDVRALLISGSGSAFTVGGDLRQFAAAGDDLAHELDSMIGPFHRTLQRLAELPFPVVCAVQGGAGGGGLGFLWASDIVIVADDLKLATGFARIGASGDGGGTWWLPRLVGLPRARELLLAGRALGAQEALAWGLVNQVVSADQLDEVATARARELAAGPTHAYAELRELLRHSSERSLAEGLAAEHAAFVRCGATEDAREGVRSFLEKRAPRFTGR